MSLEAGTKALLDAGEAHHTCRLKAPWKYDLAGITYDAVGAAFVGFCYSETMSGQVGLSISHLTP